MSMISKVNGSKLVTITMQAVLVALVAKNCHMLCVDQISSQWHSILSCGSDEYKAWCSLSQRV